MHKCELDFGTFRLNAELFNTSIAEKFHDYLPCTISLISWGKELYGPISKNLGEENPTAHIPAGGLAYTNQGNYICIFFGQEPAWSVEYIGRICGDEWKKLLTHPALHQVSISRHD